MGIALVIVLIRGSVNFEAYGSTLALLGLLLIGFAVISVAGAWGQVRSFRYQHASSAGPENIQERFRSSQRDVQEAYGFFASSTIVGSVSVAIGVILFFF